VQRNKWVHFKVVYGFNRYAYMESIYWCEQYTPKSGLL